tara:strand:+ start:159 stop:296 length:138 start_codon:yes stop_codon:yes gene_type:complete
MKKPISATLDEELVKWLDRKISDKKRFRNRSHLIEVALEEMRRKE